MKESKTLKQIIGISMARCLTLKVAITCKVDAWVWLLFFKTHIINNKNGTIARVVRAIKALDCEFWGLFKNKVTRTTKKMKRNCTNTRVNTQTKGKKLTSCNHRLLIDVQNWKVIQLYNLYVTKVQTNTSHNSIKRWKAIFEFNKYTLQGHKCTPYPKTWKRYDVHKQQSQLIMACCNHNNVDNRIWFQAF